QITRWLAAEAVASDVERPTGGRHGSLRRGDGIDRVATGRRQDQVSRLQGVGPGLALDETAYCLKDLSLGPFQAADAAEQVREALEIAGCLQLAAAHHRWKAEYLRISWPMAGDQRRQGVDHAFVETCPGAHAISAHGAK